MAPGEQQSSRAGKCLTATIAKPAGAVVTFCKRVLDVRFCHDNPPPKIARALGLVTSPICALCGFLAFFFGPWHAVQGAVAIAASFVLLALEKPLFSELCTALRKKKLVRAWLYSVLSLPLFLSWYTLFAGVATMSVASLFAFSAYLPRDKQEEEEDDDDPESQFEESQESESEEESTTTTTADASTSSSLEDSE